MLSLFFFGLISKDIAVLGPNDVVRMVYGLEKQVKLSVIWTTCNPTTKGRRPGTAVDLCDLMLMFWNILIIIP